jgi:hypothetical protein
MKQMPKTKNPHLNPFPPHEGEEAGKYPVDRAVPKASPARTSMVEIKTPTALKLASPAERPIHLPVKQIMRMTVGRSIFVTTLLCLFVSCESTIYYTPPVVTSKMARTRHEQPVDLTTLQKGRTLFVHRCIECHTLPPIWHYRVEDWPPIVDSMARRASLKPADREAIIAYIRAVRAQR